MSTMNRWSQDAEDPLIFEDLPLMAPMTPLLAPTTTLLLPTTPPKTSLASNENADEATDDFDAIGSELWNNESMDDFADELQGHEVTFFCHGDGQMKVQPRFTRVVETAKRRKRFIENGRWMASPDFSSLPYIWHRPRRGRIHHFADVIRVNTIVARELGFDSAEGYIRTRGWSIRPSKGHQNKGRYTLEYRKLQEIIIAEAPSDESRQLCLAFNAMVEELYKTLNREATKDPFTGEGGVRFLDVKSFVAKLNQHAQDFQVAHMITKNLFLPVTETKQDDVSYWMMQIFRHCHTRKDFILFCNNLLSLVPNGGNRDLCRTLLKDHPNSMSDYVGRLAAARAHQERYGEELRMSLHANFKRGTRRNDDDPSLERSLIMMRSRVRDFAYNYLPDEDKERYQSVTRKRGKGKASNTKRKVTTGECMGSGIVYLSCAPYFACRSRQPFLFS